MHVLFITEKYHSGPNFGLTNNMYNLIGSYECANYGTYTHKFIDPENIWSSSGVDEVLLNNEYNAAVISVYHHLPSPGVAQRVGNKTVMCWWDAIVSLPGIHQWANYIHQLMFDHGKGQEYPNCFSVEVPQDSRIFCRDGTQEDIDVSFVGSIDAPRSDRGRVMAMVHEVGQKYGWKVWAGGGRGPGLSNLSIEEYAGIHKRSKICLNLSYGHGRPQRKGRSFEIAACGKFMLANCPEMYSGKEGTFFDDGIDYVSFDDSNLIDKIKYYLEHDEERQKIADSIYSKYVNNYAPNHFWSRVLNICGAWA